MAQQPTIYQKQIIQDPQDIGNYFPTGLCMGPPTASGALTPGFSAAGNEITAQSALAYGYGNGLLLGPTCTYRIFPAAPFQAISAILPFSEDLEGTTVTFVANTASPRSTQLLNKRSGQKVIQFDVPRTFQCTLNADETESSAASITAIGRGIDIWGRKVTTSVTATTASSLTTEGIVTANSASALFQLHEIEITAVELGDAGAAPIVTFESGSQFGLPYKLTDLGHVQSYSQWWEQIDNPPVSLNGANGYRSYNGSWTEMTSNPAIPFYFVDSVAGTDSPGPSVYPFELSFPANLSTGFNSYDANAGTPPIALSATTTDVRGLVTPQAKLIWEYDAGPPVTYTVGLGDNYEYQGPFTISYYVPGADVFPWKYSQMMNQFQQSALLDGSVAQGGWEGFGQSFYANTNGNTNNNCEPSLEMLIGPEPYSDF